MEYRLESILIERDVLIEQMQVEASLHVLIPAFREPLEVAKVEVEGIAPEYVRDGGFDMIGVAHIPADPQEIEHDRFMDVRLEIESSAFATITIDEV